MFALVAIALLIENWHLINITNFEVSDFAANSLLIQKAKSFTLLIGNYSRVGFNHPGPAILYVLAWGELVFNDWFHLVKSPFSGQQIAAILYNAFWISLLFNAFKKITQSITLAVLVSSVFLFVASVADFKFFAGMWFPELYFFPFAVMLVAASRLANGKKDLLPSLALSAGFLINGHVSFIAILGIIFLMVLVFNTVIFKKSDGDRLILSVDFFANDTALLILSIALLFLFFVPLLIETVIDFPGPVAAYASFGRGHQPNSLSATFKFTGMYWISLRYMWVGLAVVIWLMISTRKVRSDSINEGIRSISMMIIAATIAVLFYAKYGVDLLDQVYIALFYYTAPALAICVVLIFIKEKYLQGIRKGFLIIIAAGFFVATLNNASKLPEYAVLYDHPEIVSIYNAMVHEKTDGRLVLDLDGSNDWEYVWENIIGVEIYAKRKDVDLFCINKSWHISFTKEAKCTQAEIVKNKQFWVRKVAANEKISELPKFKAYNLEFFAKSWPKLIGFGYVSVAENPSWYNIYFLQGGWSEAGSEWVWMQASEAHLSLPLKSGFSGTITLDLSAYLPKPETTQHADIYVNNKLYAQVDFSAGVNRQNVNLNIHDFTGEMADLKIVDRTLQSPKANGQSEDARTLGVGLYGFKIQER